ncbi:MAG TPA: cysteine desulfurase family protein [Candidatus Dormibacteraeota bacterium]|nr:cysteine desulfurase family protein [Candidatus Dormibacteraeota bacterium]
MKKPIYLDYAAATPMDLRVLAAMQPYWSAQFANPSGAYALAKESKQALEGARKRIAKILGAKPTEIIFVSGSTEAANIAIQGIAKKFPQGRVLAAATEHESVLNCVEALGERGGLLPVESSGLVSVDKLAEAISDSVVLVAIAYANNEIGTIQPLTKIAQVIERIRMQRSKQGIKLPLYLYSDAAQAGELSLQVSRLGVDIMSMGGQKLYGPHNGFLYTRTGTEVAPVIYGGGQERGVRSGTEDVAAAIGLAKALELAQKDRTAESRRQAHLRDQLIREITTRIPDVTLNGTGKQRLAGNVNITIKWADGETLVAYLDKEGIAVATGSACTAAEEDPSHVLMAIGLTKKEAESSLRITLGRQTTKSELEYFVKKLEEIVQHLRQRS